MTGTPIPKVSRLRLACEYLQKSLNSFAGQQRALTMLVFIEDEEGRLAEAEKLYQLHYNFACCLAQQISNTNASDTRIRSSDTFGRI